jgi:pyridoxine 5-phosphate synthase
LKLKPDIVCLVPERREEVTTEGGLDVVANEKALTVTRKKMNARGIEVSLFIAPDSKQIEAASRVGTQFIELHTGAFAESFFEWWSETPSNTTVKSARKHSGTAELNPSEMPELNRLIAGAKQAHALGLRVNAGHGLNYQNLPALHRVPHLVELNIGHSIVSRAITVGMETAVKEMLHLMEGYSGE